MQQAFLLPYADYFRRLGWRVDAMARGITRYKECRETFDVVWDIEWSRNPLDVRKLTAAARRVQEVVTAGKYDIVHVHTPIAGFVTRFALRKLRRIGPKVIYTAHGFHFHSGGHPLTNALFLVLEKQAGRWTDFLVVINREDADAALRHGLVPRERLFYMPGIGVDTSLLAPERVSPEAIQRVRGELDIQPSTPLFVMVAEFTSNKRHCDVLHALARLNESAHLACAGVGRLLEHMQTLAKELKISSRVHFLGFRHDIPALMRAANATILSSRREGLPRSVMESMSLEIPVIGTAIRGVRELLESDAGLLVPVGDVEALKRAMQWVLHNPEKARAMGKRARVRVVSHYDIRYTLELHRQLYAAALKCNHEIHTAEKTA